MTTDAKRKRLAALEERQLKSAEKSRPRASQPKKQEADQRPTPATDKRLELTGGTPSNEASLLAQTNVPDPSNFLESFLADLLKGHVSRPNDVIETRVRDKVVLLDNPATGRSRKLGGTQTGRVRSLKHMSLREHRRNRSFEVPPELQRLELYAPLHALWREYIEKLTHGCSGPALLSRLLTADYHGASLSVSASKDPTYVGAEGLVVRETENTFQIVTVQNRLRVVPKRGSIFQLQVGSNLVSLFGRQLAEERRFLPTGRKATKAKAALPTIEL